MRFIKIKMKSIFSFSILLIAVNCTAQKNEEKEIFFKGNKFEVVSVKIKDTIYISDPVDGRETYQTMDYIISPIKMNGEKIYKTSEETLPPEVNIPGLSLDEYILAKLKNDNDIKALSNCTFYIKMNDLVIDKSGKVVYYYDDNYDRIRYTGKENVDRFLNKKLNTIFDSMPRIKPAELNERNVISYLNMSSISNYKIEVDNHVVTYTVR